jgi:ketosteroid isomerase-like protein
MAEHTPAANEQRARAYLRAIENRASEEELAAFFAPDVMLEQFPNRLVPKLVQSTLADMMHESAQGKKSVSKQTYDVQNAVAAADWVALQVKWEGVLSIPVAGLEAGATMRAWFAMFLQFRDGKIVRQSNYDCFEPW